MSTFDKAEYLFKKSLGIVDSRNGINYASEYSGSARPNIIASLQVMNQYIPTTAPTDLVIASFNQTNGSITKKEVSTTYPYLAKYTGVTLQDFLVQGYSYRYGDPTSASGNLNLLTNAIPANYDPAGAVVGTTTKGYAMLLTTTSGGTPVLAANGTTPWVLDTDAGYLYFTSTTPTPAYDFSTYGSPVITFWRYEGTFGVANTIGQQFTN